MSETRICIFGDSITWGANDYQCGGWVTYLRSYFENNHDDYFEFYNLGISGDNTEDVLKRFRVECEAREPQIIIIAIGANDSHYINSKDNPRIPLEKFHGNLQELINQAKDFTDKIAFIGLLKVDEAKTMPIPWSPTKFYDNENIIKYNTVVEKICQDNNIPFLSLLDLLNIHDLSDGVHPDTKGHKKIFLAIKDFLLSKHII